MIITLDSTTTRSVNSKLVSLREEGGVVALGRVLTLVIDVGYGDPEGPIEAANAASREHPCRVIVIAKNRRRKANVLDAEIRVGGDAGASEVVVLRVSGDVASAPQDTLVSGLLLPDAPIVVWWPYEAPTVPADDPLGAMAARRITDYASTLPLGAALDRLQTGYRAGDTDLGWARITQWRAVVAAALDQRPHDKVTGIAITGQSGKPGVALLAAWLSLNLKAPATITRSSKAEGITKIVLDRASGPITFSRPDGNRVTLTFPGQPDRWLSVIVRSLGEALSEELRRLDPDDVYGTTVTKGLKKLGKQK